MGSLTVRRHAEPFWAIEGDYYSSKLKSAAWKTPGMTFSSEHGACRAVGYVDAVDACVRLLDEWQIKVDRRLLPSEAITDHQLLVRSKGLRSYQKEAVDFCIANGPAGCILALDMGGGKSLSAFTVAHAFRTKTVFVCLSYAKSTILRDLTKWFPKERVVVLEGVKSPTPIDPKATFVIINYDIFYAWLTQLRVWSAGKKPGLVVDECHVVSNPKSRRAASVLEFRLGCAWCVGLSGTPMTNRPRNLWGAMELISPGRFGANFFPFGLQFCNGHKIEIETRGE